MATHQHIPVPLVPIQEGDRAIFKSTVEFVHGYMSQPGHDHSHDYNHILRVLSNAHILFKAEKMASPNKQYNTLALFLAALLHDVGDHKYAKPGEDIENQIFNVLRTRGASDELALKVQTIAKHVSYSHEVKHPDTVLSVLAEHPELAIVQDADRLDAIGAIGVGRCFAFGAAKFPDTPLSRAIDHFEEKLYKLENMMKTVEGKKLARDRTMILEAFTAQFEQESELSFALE